MLISSFVLLSLVQRKSQLEGTFKYVAINLLSSTLFLIDGRLL
jgi:formate hydrogenlyase subunit 3/multisubunit Na+/H+ antiporter MnhD subunit